MGLWMSEQTALTRLVEDDEAPIMARCSALQQLKHPELAMLRRLLVETKTRKKPVPSRLKALASLAYARELELKRMRKLQKAQTTKATKSDNALGI